jgi:Kef-type K+ transport system membrane component KefB
MNHSYEFILTIGCILLVGLFADAIGKHTRLPRVTLLLLFGLVIGVNGLNIVPMVLVENYNVISDIALIMIGFLVGGKLTRKMIGSHGSEVILITISVVIVTAFIVTSGLYLAGISLPIAMMLGCISTATAPAATMDVIIESNKSGIFVDRLAAIVALDDLFGLILFSICLAILPIYQQNVELIDTPILIAFKEIIGAVILGVLIGIPASYMTGRAVPGQPLLIEALGLIMICGGLAILLDVSYLISAIIMGGVVTNYAKHHEYSFHEIENIEWPIMMIFFTFAGASIHLVSLIHVAHLILIYILLRVFGKIFGAVIGCRLSSVDSLTSKWLGSALMPQAGVAIGMALVTTSYLPEHKDLILTVIISTTIIFEILGPIFTRLAIQKVIP